MTQLEKYISENEPRFLEELKTWLRIPSISTLPEHAGDVRRAAEFARAQLRDMDFAHAELIETEGHPLVYGEWLREAGQPILLIYGHYDVQPVDPIAEWKTPPFEPTVIGDNLYARGASDDKGQTMLVLKALDSLLHVHGRLPVNVRVLLEGEEEAGGESVEAYVRRYPERLQCDAAFICDTGMPAQDTPALIYGLRGITYSEVEVRGAKHDLHSGEFGGVAPNPLHALALMIASLKGADGRINIPGLYESVREPTAKERALWGSNPQGIDDMLKHEMGVKQFSGENAYSAMERIAARPTLEVHGIKGGFVGEGAKTVIPAVATAKISLRLPPALKSAEAYELFAKRVMELAPPNVEVTVRHLHGGEGILVEPDSQPMQAAIAALEEVYGQPPLLLREGGSIPVAALFHEVLHAPVVLMGFALPSDNVHAPNEKYALTQFYRGLRTVALFLQNLGR